MILLGELIGWCVCMHVLKRECVCVHRLCKATSKKYPGSPFRPTRAVSIDLFPHTEHCELVIEFMRDDVLEEYLKENSTDKPTEDAGSNDVNESVVPDVHANEETTTNNQKETIPSSSSPVTNEEKET